MDIHEFANTLRKMEDATSKSIKISHGQVLEITVGDLIEKYKHNLARGDKEWVSAFEKVLSYYLDEQEMSHLTKRAADGLRRPSKSKGVAKSARR